MFHDASVIDFAALGLDPALLSPPTPAHALPTTSAAFLSLFPNAAPLAMPVMHQHPHQMLMMPQPTVPAPTAMQPVLLANGQIGYLAQPSPVTAMPQQQQQQQQQPQGMAVTAADGSVMHLMPAPTTTSVPTTTTRAGTMPTQWMMTVPAVQSQFTFVPQQQQQQQQFVYHHQQQQQQQQQQFMYTSSAQFALPTPAPTPNHFGSNSSSGPASPSSTPTAQTPTGTGSQAASASPTPRTSPTPAPTVTTTGSFTPTTTATSVSAAATITTTSSRPPIAPGEHTCANCGISHSPLWRRTPDRAQVLCNACGLYLKTYKEPRPLRLRKRKVRGVYGAVLAALTAGENGAPRSSAPSTSPSLSPPPVAESTMSTATPIITTSTTTTTAAPLVSAPPATDIMQQLFGVNGSVPIALPSITSTTVAKRSYDLMAAEDAVDIHVDQATPAAKRARTSLSPLTLSTPSSSLWAQPLQVACTKCGSSSTSQWHHASPATASSSPSGATMATAGIDSDIPHSPPPSPPTPRGAFSLSSSAPSPSTVVVAALMCHACATTQTLACAADDADVAAAVGDLVLEAGGKDRVAAWIAQWERRLSIARRAASGFV